MNFPKPFQFIATVQSHANKKIRTVHKFLLHFFKRLLTFSASRDFAVVEDRFRGNGGGAFFLRSSVTELWLLWRRCALSLSHAALMARGLATCFGRCGW